MLSVEQALLLWVKHMEEKGEAVNRPMLVAKHIKLEESFNVPDDEQLRGESWVTPFCRNYKVKEYQQHGEAGSVNLASVEAEQLRLQTILGQYAPDDIINFDKSSMSAFYVNDEAAWDTVTPKTIKHCWNHTQILPSAAMITCSITPAESTPEKVTTATAKGWQVIHKFAVLLFMTLPQAEKFKSIFGTEYVDDAWRPALNTVLEAENDELTALEAIKKLTIQTIPTIPTANSTRPVSLPLPSVPSQLQEFERGLIATVDELKAHKCIFGTPMTLEEMLNSAEEQEIGESAYRFEGRDDEIVATVQKELDIEAGNAMEVDESDDEGMEKAEEELTTKQVMDLCQQM
ncbi:hypothetical protein CVT25_007696 [Psilocybe cyanescens]|uniref:HTH CENPB-type domain-containing protein n=1 Tax=Psilocybe cyanescens TaxID=93625 RepID=A0A409XV81_PSICY|nr:hypothetical protein CVT25_007696 [Psilocybe cyanescens]